MKGYQLEFFCKQDIYHHGKRLSDWLLDVVRTHGIRGATVFQGSTGFGHDRNIHATHLLDVSDHPVQVTMVVNEAEYELLLDLLLKENLHLFYVKVPVEFGRVGEH